MATCQIKTGFLFWKKPCGVRAVGRCQACGIPACHKHGNNVEGNLLCDPCWKRMRPSSRGYHTSAPVIHQHVYHDRRDDVAFNSSDSSAFRAGDTASGSWDDASASSSDDASGSGSWEDPS